MGSAGVARHLARYGSKKLIENRVSVVILNLLRFLDFFGCVPFFDLRLYVARFVSSDVSPSLLWSSPGLGVPLQSSPVSNWGSFSNHYVLPLTR